MLKDEIEEKIKFKKRPKENQSQPVLTFETRDLDHETKT